MGNAMRCRETALLYTMLALFASACDTPKDLAPKPAASSSAPLPEAPRVEAPKDAAATPMPERPVPRSSPTVGTGMSEEVQMKAITYMAAMRAPHPDDAQVNTPFVTDLVKRLGPISLSMDKGPEVRKMNRVEIIGGGRQIDLLMSSGCTAETPTRIVVQGAGIQLSTLVSNGVLVVRCNDSRAQCLQSTRDPTDILCTTAPRRK